MNRVLQSEKTRVVLGVGFLFLLALAPSLWGLARGMWPFDDDAVALFAPWRQWAQGNLERGVLPLWNPHLFGGMPFMSNGQTAVLYPPNLLYWLLPMRGALFGDALVHGVLLGCGGYALARALERSRSASVLCALCLVLGAGVAAHLYAGHMTWHAARAYLPWELWALVLFLRSGERRYALWLGLFFVLQLASGYPPYVIWSIAWCVLIGVLYGWSKSKASDARMLPRWPRHALLAGVLAILLAGAVALPLRETSRLAVHGVALPYKKAIVPSSTWAGWARLAVPNFFGGNRVAQWSIEKLPHEEAAYIGLIPLLLAAAAPFWWRRSRLSAKTFFASRFVWGLWLLLPLAMLLALGDHTPVYRWLYDSIPPLRMFRAPSRWLEIWYIAASILAAFGFDACFRKGVSFRKDFTALLTALIAVLCVLAVVIGLSRPDSEWWLQRAQWNKTGIEATAADRLQYAAYLQTTALQSVLIAAAVAVIALLLLRRLQSAPARSRRYFAPALLCLIALDLLLAFWASARLAPDADPRTHWPAGLAKHYQPGQRWATALQDEAFSFGLDQGLPLGIDSLGGYDALAPGAFFDFASKIEGEQLWSSQYQPTQFHPLWRVAGITHVLASPNDPMVRFLQKVQAQKIAEFGEGAWARQLWQVDGSASGEAWPRFYFAREVLRAPEEEQLDLLQTTAGRKFTGAVIVGPEAFHNHALPSTAASDATRVLRSSHGVNTAAVAVRTSSPQLLVHSEAIFPGWRAWVDGRESTLQRANYLFRATAVPSGAQRVVFVYDSNTYRFGVFLSLCGLMLLAGVLSAGKNSRVARRQRE